MLEAGVQLVDGIHMHPGLMRKGRRADIGQIAGKREVGRIRQRPADAGQALHLLGRDAVAAGLELKVGQNRREIGVAAALAEPQQSPLHMRRPGKHRLHGARHGQAGIVVAVNADFMPRKFLADQGRDFADLPWEGAAVGIAEAEGIRPGLGRRTQHAQGVIRVFRKAVEEMLGVEDDPPARLARKAHAIRDHGKVLLRRSLQHMRHMQGRGLAEDADGLRSRREQGGQRRILLRAGILAAGAAKGDEL